MSDTTITAPITTNSQPFTTVGWLPSTALEEFKQAIGDEEVSLITITSQNGLVVHTPTVSIAVASGKLGYEGTGPDVTEKILSHLGVPSHLFNRANKDAWHETKDWRVAIWKPRYPVETSFIDKLFGRKNCNWQYNFGIPAH